MVHRPVDSRLLANLLQQEKDYSKQLGLVVEASNASLASFSAYAAASPPPTSHIILDIAGVLASADEALRMYVRGVDEWREAMRVLKEAEEEVGNIIRDREILVTRVIKASKPSKSGAGSIRESLLLSNQRFSSTSSLSLSVTGNAESPSPPPSRPLSSTFSSSSKLAAAQSELQACEAHLAAKERELSLKRNAAIRDGLGVRMKAMIQCGGIWCDLGKNALHTLDELHTEQPGFLMQHADSHVASDFSSISPSQSASQINGHEPPPISIASVMNSVYLGDTAPTPGPNSEPTQRPFSQRSSPNGSSLLSTSVPTTYQVETVTYAPAVAVHVHGKTPDEEKQHPFPTIPMLAPHALAGYAYDIPTAMAGSSGSQQPHSRSNSGHITPQQTPQPTVHTRHILERRITEDSQEEMRRNSTAPSDDSFEEVKLEKKLVEEGKLALVENPRFVSEAKRKQIEQDARKEVDVSKKGKGKQVHVADGPAVREPKKRFSLFHHSKSERASSNSVAPRAVSASTISNSTERGSPSKGFFGSLRGIFATKPLMPSSPQSTTRPQIQTHDSDDDSDSDRPHGKHIQGIFRHSDKTSPTGRWETRTDKNIRLLARSGSFDGSLAKPPPNKFGGGIAGEAVSQAGVVTSPSGRRKRVRAASADGTRVPPVEPAAPSATLGNRLKKTRAGPTASASGSAAVTNNVPAASTVTALQRSSSAAVPRPTKSALVPNEHRRSASVDPGENRKSWTERTDESDGDGIVDLGRRRRVASEAGTAKGKMDMPQRETQSAVGAPVHAKDATDRKKSAVAERRDDVFGATAPTKGYSSDTHAIQSGVTGVAKKKSLSKKREASASVPQAIPPQPTPPAATHTPATGAPTRKNSTKTKSPTTATVVAAPPTSHSTGTKTVLPAGGGQPSGVLVPQPGWNAQAHPQGGGLLRNNSVTSAASAPAGSTPRGKKKTTLGQGVGGDGGVARRASLTSGATSVKSEAAVSHPLPPAANLMSIVENMARTNREGWKQDLEARKSGGGAKKPAAGLIEVVKAPPPMERTALEALAAGPQGSKRSTAGGPTTNIASPTASTVTSSRTGMFEIRAPGSVFDHNNTPPVPVKAPMAAAHTPRQVPPVQSPPHSTIHSATQPAPLRSALRNTSRSPSPGPVAGPSNPSYFTVKAPPPVTGALPWGSDGALRASQKPVSKAKPQGPEETDPSGSEAEVFYSDLEDFEQQKKASSSAPRVAPTTKAPQLAPPVSVGQAVPTVHVNGYAINGHKRAESEVSHSSTSTAIAGATPRRRKSVRVSLHPTYSPTPPALEYLDDEEEQNSFAPWSGGASQAGSSSREKKETVPLPPPPPPPVAARVVSVVGTEQADMWADSDEDEDEHYARAKRMLSRAAKKEKDVKLLVSNSIY